ncbi:MAG: hypothetical protein AMXMBFR23_06720 [Chloroflexota bacterium]
MRRLSFGAAAAVVLLAAGLSAAPVQATPPGLAAFVSSAGQPSQATYARLLIPAIGVDAAVAAHVIPPDEAMPNPYGPADVAWYDFSNYPGMGGAPGSGGNAVFSGHVDYNARVPYAGVRYRGPGVFEGIGRLALGDTVQVTRGTRTYTYLVTSTERVAEDSPRWRSIWSRNVRVDTVTLFTCTGAFDPSDASYSHRTVVRAERVEGAARVVPLLPGEHWAAGVSGVTHPQALAARQPYRVAAIYGQDASTGEWLTYVPGAPAFVNTLVGHLRTDSFVIIRRG